MLGQAFARTILYKRVLEYSADESVKVCWIGDRYGAQHLYKRVAILEMRNDHPCGPQRDSFF